jgi:hypothetical protein
VVCFEGGGGGEGGRGLTEGTAGLGQVAELDGELHAAPVIGRDRADGALDVAAVGEGRRVEGLVGENSRVHDAGGVVGHLGGILLFDGQYRVAEDEGLLHVTYRRRFALSVLGENVGAGRSQQEEVGGGTHGDDVASSWEIDVLLLIAGLEVRLGKWKLF